MPRIAIDLENPDPALLERAARLLQEGEIVAAPSDTVYGYLALTRSDRAYGALSALKGRGGPFLVLVRTLEEARSWTTGVPERVWKVLEGVWPGPVTVILPTRERMPGSQKGTLALRMPRSRFLSDLLDRVGEPLFSTSANRPGDPPPLTAEEVAADPGSGVELVLDGGPAASREPSTLVDLSGDTPRVVRAGRGDPGPLLDPP